MQYKDFKERFPHTGLSEDQIRRKYVLLREALDTPVSAVAVSASGGGSTPSREPVSLRDWDKDPYLDSDIQNLVDYVSYLSETTGSFGDSIETVGPVLPAGNKYQGSVLAPNEDIYFIPNGATGPAKLDPETDTFSRLTGNWSATGPAGGPTGPIVNLSGVYHSGVLHPNGYIYGNPYQANAILRIDPSTDTFDFVGALPFRIRCHGGVVAPNNKIYFIPEDTYTDGSGINYFWEYDTDTDSYNQFGATSGIQMFRGGVLAPNGFIYTLPRNSNFCAKIDPDTRTVTYFGSESIPAGTNRFRGGMLGIDGKIYGVPDSATSVLCIDPSDDSVTTFGSLPVGINKWMGAVLAPDGKIVCVPYSATSFLEIDTVNRTTRTFGDIAGGGLSVGASLHPNGYAYTSPNASLVIYKFGGGNTLDPNYPLSREINIL
jgi:hypothetical protein